MKKEEKDFYTMLGANIRNNREKKGFKTIKSFCQELAEHFDISDSMFGKYELGTEKISVLRLAIVAKVLNINVFDLIPDIDCCYKENPEL